MERPLGRLSLWLDRIYEGLMVAAAGCVAGVALLMLVQALTRGLGLAEIGPLRIRGLDDIVAWLSAGGASLALAVMFRRGDLVRVTLLLDGLSPGWRRGFELLCLCLALAFVGYTAWAFARFVHESWALADMAQGLIRVPLWLPQLPMVVGILALWLALLEELVRVLRGAKPAYQRAAEERAAQQDYSGTP